VDLAVELVTGSGDGGQVASAAAGQQGQDASDGSFGERRVRESYDELGFVND